jgi:hypothetical protein
MPILIQVIEWSILTEPLNRQWSANQKPKTDLLNYGVHSKYHRSGAQGSSEQKLVLRLAGKRCCIQIYNRALPLSRTYGNSNRVVEWFVLVVYYLVVFKFNCS